MDDENVNPYTSPTPDPDEIVRKTRWRIVPAAFSFLFGGLSLLMGLFAVGVMTYVLLTNRANETVPRMIAGCSMYLGFGAVWITAGCLYWAKWYYLGLVASGVGILIPVIMFSIFGF